MPSPLVRLPSLDILKGFVAVGRRMSITLAAEDMCITQSAVSKQVRALEENLGVKLLERGYRKIAFTEAGERLFNAANLCISQFQEQIDAISALTRAPVTVTASIGTTGLWLLPRLGEFQRENPKIDVRIAADNRVADLELEDIDLAIRYGPAHRIPNRAEHLFDETVAPVASPLLGLNTMLSAATLSDLTLLEFEEARSHPWLRWGEWLAMRGLTPREARSLIRFNQYDQVIQTALGGQGIALGRLELVSAALLRKQLVRLPGQDRPVASGYSYWLVRGANAGKEEVQVVASWLLACAAETRRAVEIANEISAPLAKE